jgi:ribonuclease Z
MRSVFYPHLVGGQHGDPALYVRNAHRREALLFDCGALANLPPKEMGKIHHLFISHTHVDHFIGFDRLVRFFLYTDHRLAVYGPAGIARQVGNRLGSYTWNLVDGYPFEIEVNEWTGDKIEVWRSRARNAFRMEKIGSSPCDDGRLLKTPVYHVTATPLTHGNIVSLAYNLEEVMHVAIHKDALEEYGYQPGPWLTRFKDLLRVDIASPEMISVPLTTGGTGEMTVGDLATRISHTEAGMKICYVTDVCPSVENLEKIEELARDAHLLAIEAPFAHADLERAKQRNHLTAQLAGDVARRAGAKRCLFFHFSPRYQQSEINLQEEAQKAFTGENLVRGAGQ